MDLMCKSTLQISIIFTAFFAGYLTGVLGAGLPDAIGRKRATIYGFSFALTCEAVMLVVPNYYVRMFGFFGLGLA